MFARIIFGLLILDFAWQLLFFYLEYKSAALPIPENVRDVYDEKAYGKWRSYHRENLLLSAVGVLLSRPLLFCLLFFHVHARILPNGLGTYGSLAWVLVFQILFDTVLALPIHYVDVMKVEEKYGFNKTTKKTFFLDALLDLVISLAVSLGIMSLFAFLHLRLGVMLIPLFAGLLFLFVLALTFLFPILSRVRNKFTPLEEGELREKLLALMEGHGYHVREIQVMDASRRTTKLNAYFTGFGKMKTIVLYDNLVSSLSTEEICAVFAHEMGHGIHKDTLKGQILNLVSIFIMAVLLWWVVSTPGFFTAFGFEGVNYGFAYILLDVILSVFSPLMEIPMNLQSRKAEYRADAVAKKEGYGENLIKALKQLYREDLGNLSPHPVLVFFTYDHPTLSQRIAALEGE